MTSFALALRVSLDTGQATPIALVAFFTVMPEILLGNLAGWVADYYDRRYVMAFSDTGQAIGTVILLVSFATDNFQLEILYIVTLIQAIFLTFQTPASEAVTATLVPDAHRDRANAFRQMSGSLAGVFAPALAALLFSIIGVVGVMALDLTTFGIAMLTSLWVKIPRPEHTANPDEPNNFFGELAAGFTFLWSRRMLFYFILYASVMNFVLDASTTITIPYVLARTNGDTNIAGLVSIAENLGIILGGVLIGLWGGTRPRIHTIVISAIAIFAALSLFGTLRHPALLCLGMFAITFPLPIGNAPFFSMLQAKVPADLQGRVFAVVMQISSLFRPVGLLLIGPLVDRVAEPAVGKSGWDAVAPIVGDGTGAGMGLILFVAGGTMAIMTLLFYLLPTVRSIEATLPDYNE